MCESALSAMQVETSFAARHGRSAVTASSSAQLDAGVTEARKAPETSGSRSLATLR
jgi:hypothetical protein